MDEKEQESAHRTFAVNIFNQTWDLIDKKDKNQEDIDRMIHSAHASRYHWELVGEPVNLARGEWLISRVYALLDRAEPCLYHANRCLQITLENDLKDFDLAFAYEAAARAYSLAGRQDEKANYLSLAKDAGTLIKKADDRNYFFSELETINIISPER